MENQNKRQKIRIGSIILVLFLVIYIPSLFHWASGKSIATDIIRMDVIEDSINTDACLIRDEEVLISPFEGKYIPSVNEGEKVPANFSVATVLKGSSEKTLEDIRELDESILERQKNSSKNQVVFSQDIVKLDEEILEEVKSLALVSNSGSFEKYEDIKEQLDSTIKKKATVLGGFGTADSTLNALKNKRKNLQGVVDSSTRNIVSTYPGIISYTVDGFEEYLTPSAIKELTPKKLEGIKAKNAQIKSTGRNVEVNKPFAKIIKGIEAYFAAVVDTKSAAFINVNNGVNLRVNDVNKVIAGTVIHKSGEESGKCVVVIKTDRLISETAFMRRANIDFIKKSYNGFKVPLKSLIDIDPTGKKARIVLVKANYASIRNVIIEGRNSEFAIIKSEESKLDKGVGLYDTFVINPGNIEEGQLINK